MEELKKINFEHWAHDWLLSKGIAPNIIEFVTLGVDLILLILISLSVDFIARKLILRLVGRYVRRSKNDYDDVFLEKRVFRQLAHLLPALIVHYSLPYIFDEAGFSVLLLQKATIIYIIVVLAKVVHKFLKALEEIARHIERFREKPISSYTQVFLIVIYIAAAIFIISTIFDKSAVAVLTTFGAATAIILLIFRDTILGLVASIQIAGNDMVRVGDWVSMEKYGADGDVLEINLTTVKVRNWDKTISTVPTYAFISDSFKNWRGMTSLGVRRIKRALHIDLNTIRFVDDELLQRFQKFERIKDYLQERQIQIKEHNEQNKVDKSELLNGRHMTNLGVFRNYVLNFLLEHPKIDNKETVMVRQLQASESGLPLEIYCFSNDIAWVNYEAIQSDIMDHLFAAVDKFDLQIYQSPAGRDFQTAFTKS